MSTFETDGDNFILINGETGETVETITRQEADEFVRTSHGIPSHIDIPFRTLGNLFIASMTDKGKWWGVKVDDTPHRWSPDPAVGDMLVCLGDLFPEFGDTYASLWVISHQPPYRPRLAEVKARIEEVMGGAFHFPVWAEEKDEDPQAMD